MTSFRLTQIGLSFCLMASLLVGSVSACACSHHQPKVAAEPPSCHSSSHVEASEAKTAEELSGSFKAGCNCFAASPGPAIFSKSENKKAVTEKAADAAMTNVELSGAARIVSAPIPDFDKPFFFDPTHFLASGPSRAPPRL